MGLKKVVHLPTHVLSTFIIPESLEWESSLLLSKGLEFLEGKKGV
jgi:hypothetical protein